MGMTFATLLSKDRISVALSQVILAPDELLDVMSSVALLENCEKACLAERNASDEYRLAQERRGYADGTMQANTELAEKLLATEISIANFWTAQEDRLVELVAAVLHRLAPALSASDLIHELVVKAVQEVRDERWLVVRVHPENLPSTRRALKSLRTQYPNLTTIDVSGNEDLGLSDCIIESPNGFLNASWSVQVNALQGILKSFSADALKAHAPRSENKSKVISKKLEPVQTNT
jgi:type III secretion protein L